MLGVRGPSGGGLPLNCSLQMLPLVPPDKYWSPYSGLDALCGNPLLIPLDELVQLGLLKASELPPPQPVELTAGRFCTGQGCAMVRFCLGHSFVGGR